MKTYTISKIFIRFVAIKLYFLQYLNVLERFLPGPGDGSSKNNGLRKVSVDKDIMDV